MTDLVILTVDRATVDPTPLEAVEDHYEEGMLFYATLEGRSVAVEVNIEEYGKVEEGLKIKSPVAVRVPVTHVLPLA